MTSDVGVNQGERGVPWPISGPFAIVCALQKTDNSQTRTDETPSASPKLDTDPGSYLSSYSATSRLTIPACRRSDEGLLASDIRV